MSKRIETIEDLAEFATAELDGQKSKIKGDVETESKSTQKTKPKKPKTLNAPKKSINPKKSKASKKSTPLLYNAFETGVIDFSPYGLFNLKDELNKPNPTNGYTRRLKKEDLLKFIEEETRRAERMVQYYQSGIDRGENNIGYVLVNIAILRDIARMQVQLVELEEKA